MVARTLGICYGSTLHFSRYLEPCLKALEQFPNTPIFKTKVIAAPKFTVRNLKIGSTFKKTMIRNLALSLTFDICRFCRIKFRRRMLCAVVFDLQQSMLVKVGEAMCCAAGTGRQFIWNVRNLLIFEIVLFLCHPSHRGAVLFCSVIL